MFWEIALITKTTCAGPTSSLLPLQLNHRKMKLFWKFLRMCIKAATMQWYPTKHKIFLIHLSFKIFWLFSKEGKKRTAEAVKVLQVPDSLIREGKQSTELPEPEKQKLPAHHSPILPTAPNLVSKANTSLTIVKPPHVSGGKKNEVNSVVKDDLLNESDPVKLERKRRQQQKKEEFLQQQMKRHKPDDNRSVPAIHIKSEQTSPIPEGSLLDALRSSHCLVRFLNVAIILYVKQQPS